MPTANENKALWFLAFVALSGGAVRLWRVHEPLASVAETSALDRQIARVDSVRDERRTSRRAVRERPSPRRARAETTAVSATIDLDRAAAAEIEALPGIGPSLAQRIVASRDSAGPFGSLEALCDVRGVGPALVEKLRPMVTFSGPRRHLSATCGGASKKARKPSVTPTRQPR